MGVPGHIRVRRLEPFRRMGQTEEKGIEARVDIVPEVAPYGVIIEKIRLVIEAIEAEKKIMVAKEAVLIEGRDEQEHSFSMPLPSAR
ncbi:MAG: hypothetical protein VYB00_00540 [Candidatus Thermoplasmatota archaeon]|nr:hypothetical protein [Candidatus Thermoplasmatota archaeon]